MKVKEETRLYGRGRLKWIPGDPTLSSRADQGYPQLGQGLCSPILTSLYVTRVLGKGRALGKVAPFSKSSSKREAAARSGSPVMLEEYLGTKITA